MSVRVLFVGCGLSAGLLFRGLTRHLRSSSAATGVVPTSATTLDKSCTSFTSVSNSSSSSSTSSGEDCNASTSSTDASRGPQVPSFSFHFWEASSSAGGRLYSHHNTISSTVSSSTTLCSSNDSGSFANTGAQYFTFGPNDLDLTNPNRNPERAFTSYLMQDLLANGVLAPMPAYQPEDIISKSGSPEGSEVHVSSEASGVPLIANVRSDHFTKRHFIAPRGTSSVVEHLLKSSYSNCSSSNSGGSSSNSSSNSSYGIDFESKDIECNKSLTSLTFNRDRNHWEASSTSNFAPEYFDMVFLSIPFPNLVQIEGNWLDFVAKFGDFGKNSSSGNSSSSSSEYNNNLAVDNNNDAESLRRAFKTVQYSSRFAVVYTFSIKNISSNSSDSAVDFFRQISYNAKYTPTGAILRYMSLFGIEEVRNSKIRVDGNGDRNGGKDGGIDVHEPVVNTVTLNILLHSSPQYYSEKKLLDDESISSEIFQSMLQLLSDDSSLSIPAVSSILGPPVETYVKRWDISQKIETSSASTSSSHQHQNQPFNSADVYSRSILAAPIKTTQDGKPHFLSVGTPTIGIFGDSFTSSNFLGCVMTAESLLNKLTISTSTIGK